jgi:aminomethyltransferase
VNGVPNVLIARTGYTGEDGFEIYFPSDVATGEAMWNAILEAGAEFGILPCGLGARNTLRLEAAMSLYGHEISDEINVFEAGLDRFCKLDKGCDFLGREALVAAKAQPLQRKLVGLEMIERGIGRDGYPIVNDAGQTIGVVTSGSPGPFIKKNIALAYVPLELSEIGSIVNVLVREQPVKAQVVPVPFYKREKK